LARRSNHVFLNIPFDDEYEPLYVALVAALTAFGIRPRSVLEIPPHENARLDRLRTLLAQCGASIHDLSRIEPSGDPPVPRFNMPFELGLALGLHFRKNHAWFIFESVRHRVTRSLSDLGGYDPGIHQGQPEGVLQAVRNAFGATKRTVRQDDLRKLWHVLRDVAPRIHREHGSLFSAAAFEDLVFAGQTAARGHFAGRTPRAKR
jgi:hypothetical protein